MLWRFELLRKVTVVLLIAFLATPAFGQKKRNAPPPEPKVAAPQPSAAGSSSTGIQQEEDEAKSPWTALHYRLVGPFRGGRVVAVSGVVGQDNVYYFGAVAGGVWKTTDGGLNWMPLFDKQKGASPAIGAIAVAQSDPNIIYVGTGEACIRGNIVGGNGVYKS